YRKLDNALSQYEEAIKKHLVGITEENPHPIVGDPVHRKGLQAGLKLEMIPYTAEELIAIGRQEFKKTEKEFRRISNEMGYGDDWQAALEYVKEQAPPPGEIPQVLADMYSYSMDYIKKMDEITIPPLSEEIWRTVMQTPERQLENPFFTGGEVTHYSYPHESMPHDAKIMSMRGNTPAFNFGTVQHELIPGHHMQGFMSRRFNSQRGNLNRTPFWSEGGAFYWEYVLYDAGYHRDNAEKIGTLFWRLHRAARIIFSLNYQLGNWSPEKAVDFLVEKGGHERANAEAEVRRSARVRPLYQISYMIG